MPYSSEFTRRYISWRFPNTGITSTWKLLIQITSRYLVASSVRDESQFRGNALIEQILYIININKFYTPCPRVYRRSWERIWGKKLAWSPNSIWIYPSGTGKEREEGDYFISSVKYVSIEWNEMGILARVCKMLG